MLENDVLLTCPAMAQVDAAVQADPGISGLVLMENAGRDAWRMIHRRFSAGASILFCAGPGNNGGDALVMARWALLEERFSVSILLSRGSIGENASRQRGILERMGCTPLIWGEDPGRDARVLSEAAWIVEGLTGTGLTEPLRGTVAEIVSQINAGSVPVVSIDLPSGARDGYRPGEPLVRADLTVVTGYYKQCLFTAAVRPSAGEILQVDPGFPPQVVRSYLQDQGGGVMRLRTGRRDAEPRRNAEPRGDGHKEFLPAVAPDGHKGVRGRVGIIGGSPGTSGAALLAGLGALYGGAGMVRICSGPDARNGDSLPTSLEPALMVDADTAEARLRLVEWADVVVVGPGWTSADDTDLVPVLKAALERKRPVVCDAHALHLLGQNRGGAVRSIPRRYAENAPGLVLTPHPGELAQLAGVTAEEIAVDPVRVMDDLAEAVPGVVVLKGAVTYVRGMDGNYMVYDGRCVALGTAGSGDVLAGLIGACCARTGDPGRAARSAVEVHLDTGRRLWDECGWFTATDLARSLGRARV